MFLWDGITLCDLANLLDGVGNFVDLLLSWLFTSRHVGWLHDVTSRNDGRVNKDWLRSIPLSNTWNIKNSWIYSSSIWFIYILQLILQLVNRMLSIFLDFVEDTSLCGGGNSSCENYFSEHDVLVFVLKLINEF